MQALLCLSANCEQLGTDTGMILHVRGQLRVSNFLSQMKSSVASGKAVKSCANKLASRGLHPETQGLNTLYLARGFAGEFVAPVAGVFCTTSRFTVDKVDRPLASGRAYPPIHCPITTSSSFAGFPSR